MTQTIHWGKFVDSEIPVPGVISQNRLNWEYIDDEICLDCEEIQAAHDEQREIDSDYEEDEEWECFDHQKLIGDWKKVDGQYEPDFENGEY